MMPVFLSLLFIVGQAGSEYELRSIGDGTRKVTIASVAADGSITTTDSAKIAGTDWYSLRRTNLLPAWPRCSQLELLIGDRIAGRLQNADGDAVNWRIMSNGKEQAVRVPISAVRVAWLARTADLEPDWLGGSRKRDVFAMRSGSFVHGALSDVDGAKGILRYQQDGKDQQLELGRVSAIAFNTELARLRRPKGQYYLVTFADGSRLSATQASFDGNTWSLQTPFKQQLRLPAADVVSVDVEQGRVTWLSELKPKDYQYQSFDGERIEWARDRCVSGQPLRLKFKEGESTYDRGVGLHADCSITYTLDGRYSRFEAIAGLDAVSGVKGDAMTSIFVDGKEIELPNKGKLALTGGPIPVSVDVKKAKELRMVVGHGQGGNVQDHVNFAEARLVP